MMPTTPISVFKMPNTPTARMKMRSLLLPLVMNIVTSFPFTFVCIVGCDIFQYNYL